MSERNTPNYTDEISRMILILMRSTLRKNQEQVIADVDRMTASILGMYMLLIPSMRINQTEDDRRYRSVFDLLIESTESDYTTSHISERIGYSLAMAEKIHKVLT